MSASQTRELKPVDADEVKRLIDWALGQYDAALLMRLPALLKNVKDRGL